VRRLSALPVRWRLALTSAGLTLAILLLFALVAGFFTTRQVKGGFDDELGLAAADVQDKLRVRQDAFGLRVEKRQDLGDLARGHAVIRVVDPSGNVVGRTEYAPYLGRAVAGIRDVKGFRVVTRELYESDAQLFEPPIGYVQYGRPTGSVDRRIGRVQALLALGVVGGTVLAFFAGFALARRAMAPVVALTGAAKEIARTRDPDVRLPQPEADDEVADLARTLDDMLRALAAARAETEGTLSRQREFVADASHELRTPLTSVFANLELLEARLAGEDREIAESALRSSRRMRRLVADLLLLARADSGRAAARERVELSEVVHDAASEVAPLAPDHELELDLEPGVEIDGSADDLHRLVLNLLENAVIHTPPATPVRVLTRREGTTALLRVEDDGPGVPPELRDRIWERFVRGSGDSGGPGPRSGLGLSIVEAVARRHGGTVGVSSSPAGGARFEVRLAAEPAGALAPGAPAHASAAATA
jgi:signal transduction histidine kinase